MNPTLPDQVLFGAAYYLEYQQNPDLDRDLDLMVEAGFSLIRVGESVWSTWEPDEGRFCLDWLEEVLDGAHARGLRIILGTPTYAIPMWLARRFPEVAGERSSGTPIGWGARQESDFTHPAHRFYAERIVRRILRRYAEHPAIIGFQVDNEPGNELLHNHGVFQQFVDELRTRYGTVDRLNAEWGLTYWSHRLSSWADLWRPDGNAQPQYDLAWRRHQARLTTEMIRWQAEVVREYARPDQFVTTCIAYDRPALEDTALSKHLDVTSGNAYYRMQDHLELPPRRTENVQTWMTSGTWAVYRTADRMYASRQEPFLVTETDASSIWGSSLNEPAYDGQWRQAAWALISRGARAVEYWHWHTLPYGAETYWGGVLPHSGEPGRVYNQVAELGQELRRAADDVVGLVPEADLGIIYSTASKWALSFQPPFGGLQPDSRSYEKIVDAWYETAFDAGVQARFLHDSQLAAHSPAALADELPVLVAAGFYCADQPDLELLRDYAAAGGHLILGIRTGCADGEARVRSVPQPPVLADAAGVHYDEFSTVEEVPIRPDAVFDSASELSGQRWIDGLIPAPDVEVLAEYEHPHFSRWPAVTTRRHGAGRITVVGTHPSRALGAEILRWAIPEPSSRAWLNACPAPEQITVTGAKSRDESARIRFIHNWSWTPTTLELPTDTVDVLDDARPLLQQGTVLTLGPWDVKVLRTAP